MKGREGEGKEGKERRGKKRKDYIVCIGKKGREKKKNFIFLSNLSYYGEI